MYRYVTLFVSDGPDKMLTYLHCLEGQKGPSYFLLRVETVVMVY